MNLLDLGLDKDLNQGPYERAIKGVIDGLRVVIICMRVNMIVKL